MISDNGIDGLGSGRADPHKVKEFWTEVVRSAADRGKLDKIPARKPRNLREKSQAKAQNHAITRKSFGGFGANYERIQWKTGGRTSDVAIVESWGNEGA